MALPFGYFTRLLRDRWRRPDRSLGWPALESRTAAALARKLSRPSPDAQPSLPPELSPFPVPKRRARGPGEIAVSIAAWLLALQLCYVAMTSLLVAVYRFVDPPATVLMAYRKWGFGWEIKAPRPVKLSKVPPYIRSMLISIEDGKFYQHHGLDFDAIARAREINRIVGRPLYGGSTLTMQVARTLFLVPEKSYLRKYLEVIATLEIEALLPKDRILELYFGYAEWGRGLFGIEAAARKWYGSTLTGLSRDQAARLVSLLSSPIKYGPATLQRNAILKERYRYLSQRFDPGSTPAPIAQEQPPPSPEPGTDPELGTPEAAPPEPTPAAAPFKG